MIEKPIEPTQAEIRQRCRQIQSRWSAAEERRRRIPRNTGPNRIEPSVAWSVPIVAEPSGVQ